MNKYQLDLKQVFVINIKDSVILKGKKQTTDNQYFLDSLPQTMQAHTLQLKNIPQNFATIKTQVDEARNFYVGLTKEVFKKDFTNNLDENDFVYLLEYLEFTGSILYFRKVEGINHYIFQSPPKLSDWIFNEILTEKLLKKEEGRLATMALINVHGKEKIDILIQLLLNFDLTFKQAHRNENNDANEEYYIIPQYLPDNNHSFKKVLLNLLPYTFGLQFVDFFHEGQFFKFISQFGKYAKGNTAFWKFGILFTYPLDELISNGKDNIEVLVYYLSEERKILVHIQDKKGKTEIKKMLFKYFLWNNKEVKLSTREVLHNEIVGNEYAEEEVFKLKDKKLKREEKLPLKLNQILVKMTQEQQLMIFKTFQ